MPDTITAYNVFTAAPKVVITVTEATDVYLVPVVSASSMSNARITTYLTAKRLR